MCVRFFHIFNKSKFTNGLRLVLENVDQSVHTRMKLYMEKDKRIGVQNAYVCVLAQLLKKIVVAINIQSLFSVKVDCFQYSLFILSKHHFPECRNFINRPVISNTTQLIFELNM